MRKKHYFIIFICIICLLLILMLATVNTDKKGFDKISVIIPRTIKSVIFNIRSKILQGKKINIKKFIVGNLGHNFYKYYIPLENKEVSKNKPTGYLAQYSDKIIFVSGTGIFYLFDEKDFNSKKINFTEIKNNFKKIIDFDENILGKGPLGIRDIKIHDDFIYLSYQKKKLEDCYNLAIARSRINFKELNFEPFFSFDECSKKKEGAWAVLSGGRMVFKGDNIFFSIGEMALRSISQNEKSYFGKIIKFNKNNPNKVEIISKGLRNSQGMFYDDIKDLILITDHAEVSGDEINVLSDFNVITNFGWPKASYGIPYNNKPNNYLKSHKKHDFKEPVFYFREEGIGISQIIGYDLSRNNLRYLLTSMRAKKIFFLDYQNNENLLIKEDIDIGERIRDIIKINT